LKSVKLKDAKTDFLTLLDEAIHGETIEITRDGKTVASLVPAASTADGKRDFGKFLLSFPGGVEFDRDRSTLRDLDF
jgi:prevent-host-death family protein